jgi:hypothetical protein
MISRKKSGSLSSSGRHCHALDRRKIAMHENADKLIPELSLWNDGTGISLPSWLSCIARYDHAIAYAVIFWPDFVLYDNCIFLNKPDEKTYNDWITQCKGDKASVEAVMNHRHILDIFCNSEVNPTKDIVLHLGRLLKDMWQCKLQRDFPERNMMVEFYDDDSDDLLDYQITFFHASPRDK